MISIGSRIFSAAGRLTGWRIIRLTGVMLAVSAAVSCSLLAPPEHGAADGGRTPAAPAAAEEQKESQIASSAASSHAAAEPASSRASSAAAAKSASSRTAVRSSSSAPVSSRAVSSPAAAPAWPASGGVPSPLTVPNLDGRSVTQNDSAAIDLSYTSYGFVKIYSKTDASSRLKVIISHNGQNYNYDLPGDGSHVSYPLQMGGGTYTIGVYRNISGNSYAQILATNTGVSLRSSTVPFLVPSQMVNYTSGGRAASLARQLAAGKSNNYARISAVLSYVAKNIHYDQGKAASVRSGYIPDIDAVLGSGRGICFDYAAVSAAMLRSLGYPTKLVTGYVNNGRTYHAWNEVYLPGQGWIKVMAVTLSTIDWSRVDVTFVSTSTSPADIQKYIGNGANYVKQYTY